MSIEPFIVYEPPQGGQAIRPSGLKAAWERITTFLRACTDVDPDRPESADLAVYEPTSEESVEWHDRAMRSAESRFGPGKRLVWLQSLREDFSVKSQEYRTVWRLSSEQVEAARSFVAECGPWPRTTYGPVNVTLAYTFRWIDPATRGVLPGQEAEDRAHPTQAKSSLLLGLERRPWAILDGRFPFASPNNAFMAYMGIVAPLSPVTLLPSRFRHWLPTKRPSDLGFNVRKLDRQVLGTLGR